MFATFPRVQNWVMLREKGADLILLVSDPKHNDFSFDYPRTIDVPEWAAVIRNEAGTKDIVFKTAALCVIQDSSNFIPALALDSDLQVQQMYVEGGLLEAFGEQDLMYV